MDFKIEVESDLETLMHIRLEMLKVVNNLSHDYCFDKSFIDATKNYFLNGNQITVTATTVDENQEKKCIGCATLSFIYIMPTFDHPTGNRAHLMNVYTNGKYRRMGVAKKMVEHLIKIAKEKSITEISLDSTQMGRPFYESLGFTYNEAGMVLEMHK